MLPAVPTAALIPIVGQPFELLGGFVTAVGHCKCTIEGTPVIIGNGPGVCPKCFKLWAVAQVQFDGKTGQMQVAVQVVGSARPKGEPNGNSETK